MGIRAAGDVFRLPDGDIRVTDCGFGLIPLFPSSSRPPGGRTRTYEIRPTGFARAKNKVISGFRPYIMQEKTLYCLPGMAERKSL